jgi:transcriptional regulator with XRE-family HTH domain
MDELSSLGTKLRSLRKEQGLSQRDLATQSEVSANAISLIERNEISPSVATLQRLATALNVRMGYFFESDSVRVNRIHIKASDRPSLNSKGLIIAGIGQRLHEQEIEPFFVIMSPGAESGRQPVIHSGHEFVCCLQGSVEYEVDEQVYLLEEGDCLLFEAELPHHWRNPAEEEAEMLLILQTPDGSDDSVRRHFSSHPSVTHFRYGTL